MLLPSAEQCEQSKLHLMEMEIDVMPSQTKPDRMPCVEEVPRAKNDEVSKKP